MRQTQKYKVQLSDVNRQHAKVATRREYKDIMRDVNR